MSTLRDRLTPEEWKKYRSEVNKKYARSEKGKATIKRSNNSPKAKERYARYRQTEGYRLAQERRREKERAAHFPRALEARRKLRAERPEMDRAWNAVLYAIRDGVLIRPDTCQRCGKGGRIHAHHHLGYAEEHWLDVAWLCSSCHRVTHLEMQPTAA